MKWQLQMKNLCLCGILLYALCFISCSDRKDEPEIIQEQTKETLTFKGDENLNMLMDKILKQFTYTASQETVIKTFLPEQSSIDITLEDVDSKRYRIATLLTQAYELNKNNLFDSAVLEQALMLSQEWDVLCASAKPYMQLPLLQRLDTDIALSLSLLFLGSNDADMLFDMRLQEQYQSAKGSGELNTIIESHIQARLLALFGLYHLDIIQQNREHLATHKVRMALEDDLELYKDFLLKEHYDVYYRAFSLLKDEILRQQAPMDRILAKLLEYATFLDADSTDSLETENMYLHIQNLKNAYALLKAQNTSSKEARDIVHIAQNPIKNVYDNIFMSHYLYGIDYLCLSLLNEDISVHLPLALDYLQTDFKQLQITQHHFNQALFQNALTSMFIGAYALSQTYQNLPYFDELLRLIKTDMSQYADALNESDKELYYDALFTLEQTDRSKFLEISLIDEKPKDEAGYINVPLALSPQEIAQVQHIILQEKSAANDNHPVCLSPLDVSFMLSLAYQAYKAQGFAGISPQLLKIRLDEVFHIGDFSKSALATHLVDFDTFMVLGVIDKNCYVQDINVSERLNTLQRKERLCGENLYFDKENGFMTNEILPSKVLTQVADGNVYFRINEADFYLNKFIFSNDEDALQMLYKNPNTSEILPVLIDFFPRVKAYFALRLSPNLSQSLISRSKPKPCE